MRRIHTLETITVRVGRAPFWRVALAVAIALAVALALAVLVSGLFLIVLPVVLVGAIAARFLGRRVAPRPDSEVIEAEYEVIEDDRKSPDESPRDR